MLCTKPFRKGITEYPCGSCGPCLKGRARLWVARMLLEVKDHPESVFVTLTYNPTKLPEGGTLVKEDLQSFIKVLRIYLHPQKIRYFAVGEYGGETWRPHYHLIIFNCYASQENIIQKAWTKGFALTGTGEAKSISYVANYVNKKAGKKPDAKTLNGRLPEFRIMSQKPGIGHSVVAKVALAAQTHGSDPMQLTAIRIDGQIYALGKYLKEKIRKKLNVDEMQRKAYNVKEMLRQAGKKWSRSVTDYEAERKSKLEQQSKNTGVRKL